MHPGVTIQKERFANIRDELPEMFAQQYEEVILDKDGLEEDVDYMRYMALESLGVLHCVTARHDGKLVGYFFNMVVPHLHHKGLTTSASDMVYVLPAYRTGTGLGLALLRANENEMRKLGAKKMYIVTKRDGLSKIVQRMGYRHIEDGFSKWIGE